MTFIQPNKDSGFINKVLAALAVGFVASVFWLVALYNASVNLSHGFLDMRGEFQAVQTQNVALQERIFSLLNSNNFKNLAAGKNLIQDKKPDYLEIHSPWSYASGF